LGFENKYSFHKEYSFRAFEEEKYQNVFYLEKYSEDKL
jgi:hypothetical protein